MSEPKAKATAPPAPTSADPPPDAAVDVQMGSPSQPRAVVMIKPPARRNFTMDDLRRYRDQPTPAAEARAKAMLAKLGPLVLDGDQFALSGAGKITRTPREMLGFKRVKEAESIETVELASE